MNLTIYFNHVWFHPTFKNKLYTDEKSGFVALLKADPEKFEIISSFKITQGSGPHWAHPAINNGNLFIRHGNALMVYNIKN